MKKIIITGHLGRDPEGRHSPNGDWFVTFTVAISVGTKSNPKTDWIDISCNGKLAEIAQAYLKKGTKVLVEGFPSAGAYMNKDGQPVATLRVAARLLEILSSKDQNSHNISEQDNTSSTGSAEEEYNSISSDEIPF